MKRKLLLLGIIINVMMLCGCTNKKEEAIKNVVISYNNSIFSNDVTTAEQYLARQAQSNFKANLNGYKSTAKILFQEVKILAKNEEFALVSLDIDSAITPQGKNIEVLSRDRVLYYLEKENDWKIIKTGITNNFFDKKLNKKPKEIDKNNVENIIKSYIENIASGKVLEASIYLTGNLYNDAVKYNINNIPIGTVKDIELDTIASTEDTMVVRARYKFSEQERNILMVVLKINNEWKIQDVI